MPSEASAPEVTITPTPPPSASPRLVAAVVRGQRIAVPCFDWCVRDHSEERLADLSDLYHEGETLALAAPQFDGLSEVMVSSIRQDPFSDDADGGLPFWSFDAAGDGSAASLQEHAALAFIDQAIAHLEKMRVQVRQLAEVRKAAAQQTAD
ncbi:DUF6907 domain-containing protein [Streptomyces asiaticus]|uniref:DUF6907 domain-containing protein n=1 Tax=Streptomyces asiaticus TaxID=114695 RepID=UPI003F67421A